MVQFLACDHKWLCYHSLVTLHCWLFVGFRIYLSDFTSYCAGRSEHTAGYCSSAVPPQAVSPSSWVYICALVLPEGKHHFWAPLR